MEILVESQLSVSHRCGLAAMKANRVLGCVSKSTASRPRDVIIPPYLAFVRPHLEHCVQFWPLQPKTDIEKMERVQQGATKTDQKAGEQRNVDRAMFVQPEEKAAQRESSHNPPIPKTQLQI